MNKQFINEIQRRMLPYLNNEQLKHLGNALEEVLQGATVTYEETHHEGKQADLVEAFITAKRIEGCSEKTLNTIVRP